MHTQSVFTNGLLLGHYVALPATIQCLTAKTGPFLGPWG